MFNSSQEEEQDLIVKCAPFASLGWKICLFLTEVYCEQQRVEDLVFGWRQVVDKVRQHWGIVATTASLLGKT